MSTAREAAIIDEFHDRRWGPDGEDCSAKAWMREFAAALAATEAPGGFYCIDCNEVLPFPATDVAAVNAHLAADLADPTR